VAEYSLSSLHAKEIKFAMQRVPRGSVFYSRREVFMIKLYQFKPALDLPNASPFCMKLEIYLRMANLPYEIVLNADSRKAPKGKLPYIEDGSKLN
jgi:hypothetical protein